MYWKEWGGPIDLQRPAFWNASPRPTTIDDNLSPSIIRYMKYVVHSDPMLISVPFKFAALTTSEEIPEDSDKESGKETGHEPNNGRKASLILKSLPHNTEAAAWDIVKKSSNDILLRFPTVMTADQCETDSFQPIANDVYDHLTSAEPRSSSISVFGKQTLENP